MVGSRRQTRTSVMMSDAASSLQPRDQVTTATTDYPPLFYASLQTVPFLLLPNDTYEFICLSKEAISLKAF